MKTLLFIFLTFASLNFFSCSKESHRESQDKVYKGKYIANGCWPVLQFIEPLEDKFKEPAWLYGDTSHNYCATSMEVTKEYQTEKPFNFRILEIKESINMNSLHYCTSPKYLIVIEILSDTLTTN